MCTVLGMPDSGAPSEFGGAVRSRTGIQPTPPHVMESWEKLRLIYLTGQDVEVNAPINPVYFNGLIPEDEQRALREAEGVLEKGEYDVFDSA